MVLSTDHANARLETLADCSLTKSGNADAVCRLATYPYATTSRTDELLMLSGDWIARQSRLCRLAERRPAASISCSPTSLAAFTAIVCFFMARSKKKSG